MLKKTITYVDYNGVERTEDKYFNLSKAEIMEMELSTTGGLAEMITKIVAAQDTPALIKIFNLRNFPPSSPRPKPILSCSWSLQPTPMLHPNS